MALFCVDEISWMGIVHQNLCLSVFINQMLGGSLDLLPTELFEFLEKWSAFHQDAFDIGLDCPDDSIPSGILRPGKICVIGNGVVLDPVSLIGEIEKLRASKKAVTFRKEEPLTDEEMGVPGPKPFKERLEWRVGHIPFFIP